MMTLRRLSMAVFPALLLSQVMGARISLASDQTAISCSQQHVQAALDTCVADGVGGTVYIPACDPNPYTWEDGILSATTVEFDIQGSGESNTQIVFASNGYAFDFGGSQYGHESGFRGISHLKVRGITYSGIYAGPDNNTDTYIDGAGRDLTTLGLSANSYIFNETDKSLMAMDGPTSTTFSTNDTADIRLISIGSEGTDGDFDDGDAVTIYGGKSPGASFLFARSSAAISPELYVHDVTVGGTYLIGKLHGYHGVIANCTFERPAWASAYGWYVEGVYADGWPETVTFGTREALFFEDNVFDAYCHAVSGFCTSNYVFRHNTRNNDAQARAGACGIDTHEPDFVGAGCWPDQEPSRKYAGRQWEIYQNTFTSVDGLTNAAYQRAGSGIFTQNTINNHRTGITLVLGMHSRGPMCNAADGCLLDRGYDNDNCSDSDDGCCQTIDKAWIWSNTYNNVDTPVAVADILGCLRLDSAPGQPGYYDEAPAAGRDGFTWTAYTYPHPLRLPTDAISPAAPTGLEVL